MIASLKGYGRIARAVLAVIGGLLVLGIVGSLIMGVRARHAAASQVVQQAQTIADSSLALAFTPADLTGPVSPDRSFELTSQIQAIVVDPSDFEQVTLYSPEGTILYSTEQSRTGNQLPGEQDRIKEALKGVPQTSDVDGTYTVMLPLKFRSGVGEPAVVELTRPDAPVATAAGPWRTNALFLFAMLVLLGIAVFGVARVLAVVTQTAEHGPQPQQPGQPGQPVRLQQPVRPQQIERPQPSGRPIAAPQPGMREEGEARRRAEERAKAAEERLGLLQEQYRKTLEELQGFQRLAREPRGTSVDPRLEERALRAEGEAHTLRQQIETLATERERLTEQLKDLARARPDVDPDADRRSRAAELEVNELRRELQAANEQLGLSRHDLEVLKAQAGRTTDVQADLDATHIELLQAKDGLTATSSELASARRELDDARTELRALRNEEQRAAMLDDELRSAKAEIESARASHRADLVEREAELEEKVRATRVEFQRQLAEIEESYEAQLGQREADLAGRITQAESSARAASRELEGTLSEVEAARAEAAARETRLIEATDELAERRRDIATLEGEVKARTVAVAQARKEADEMRRSLVSLQADLARADESVSVMQAELESERSRASVSVDAAAASELDRQGLNQRIEKLTHMLDSAVAENAELNRRLQDFEARRQLELADDAGRTEIDDLLRVTQDRLAGQTEKLIGAEDRVKALETELATSRERLDVTEGELRAHQMSEALREMREQEATELGQREHAVPVAARAVEDRRASSPFVDELSMDAKKTISRINGITQLLKHKREAKDQAQLIKELTSYAKRLDHTVSDLAEADKLAQGTIDLQIRRTDLEAVLNRVVEESGIGSDHEVRVVSEPVKIGVDPQRTEQIVTGLLRIAGDRTPSGKAIVVRLRPMDGGALIAVDDPEPSSDASMSPMVRRFAEVQGGWAKIESREEGGSSFRVFLPDAAAPASRAEEAPQLKVVVDDPEDPWEATSAEQILSAELRRVAELSSNDSRPRSSGRLRRN
jgi:chromosome segregation ATPase